MTTTPIATTPHTASVHSDSARSMFSSSGAGQPGLSLAWHLNRQGARYLLVDAAPAPRAFLADPLGL